ncbi:MAG: 3-hydroxyacyl-CoA dehydrogenase NAD-binding domain-containing protein [Candidatus Methylomirabilales bacterium]
MERIDELRAVAVIGAGVMGSGIAQVFAQAGFAVRLMARHQAALEAAIAERDARLLALLRVSAPGPAS